jgi:hypothetical protein
VKAEEGSAAWEAAATGRVTPQGWEAAAVTALAVARRGLPAREEKVAAETAEVGTLSPLRGRLGRRGTGWPAALHALSCDLQSGMD